MQACEVDGIIYILFAVSLAVDVAQRSTVLVFKYESTKREPGVRWHWVAWSG